MYVRGELSDQWSEPSPPPRLILESGEKLENIRFSLGPPLQTDSTILRLKSASDSGEREGLLFVFRYVCICGA